MQGEYLPPRRREEREAGPALALFVTTWRLMSKLISKYDILQSSKRKKQVIFGSLGSQIVLLILSDTSSKSRYSRTSDYERWIKRCQVKSDPGPGMWFDCDKHSSQNLEYFLVMCDIFYNVSDIHWDLINGTGCQATLDHVRYLCCLPVSPYFAVLGHLFGQFLRLGPHHCTAHLIREKDGSPGNWFIRLSQTKIFWLAEISG